MTTEGLDGAIDALDPVPLCDCGNPSTATCWDANLRPPMVPCNKPVCVACCPAHRHQPGTMGYVGWKCTAPVPYLGDEPDAPGIIPWLQSWWRRNIWSAPKKAQRVWDELQRNFPPPAPLPDLKLTVGRRRFESRGTTMVEVQNWTEE